MEEQAVPSISSGSVGSRFVSQAELDEAKVNKEAAWKAAYARLGQEPPPQPVEDVYDGRSLFERLQAQKTAKQEEWDEKMKLSNQFRGLEEEEIHFLDTVLGQQKEEERARKLRDDEEVKSFKAAQRSTDSTQIVSKPVAPSKPAIAKAPLASTTSGKKDTRSLLKGVVRKKAKPKTSGEAASGHTNKPETRPTTAQDVPTDKSPSKSSDENLKKRSATDEDSVENKRHKNNTSQP